jgi:ATP-dependent RNA helicase DeaD
LPAVYRKLEWLEKEDLIKRVVSLELNRLISYYQEAADIQTVDGETKRDRRDPSTEKGMGPEAGFSKLFIGLGKMDGITPKNLMDLINDYVEGRVQIGRIDFFTRYSLFDVEEKSAKRVVTALRELDFLGRNVKVDFATEEQLARGNKDRGESGGNRGGFKGRRDEGRGGNYRNDRNEGGYKGGNYKSRSSEGGYKPRTEGSSWGSSKRDGGYGAKGFEAKPYNKDKGYTGAKNKDGFKKKRY